MADSFVVVKAAGIVVIDGADQTVVVGELFPADHPAVRNHPELFGPVTVRFPTRAAAPKVEKATAAPGEKR